MSFSIYPSNNSITPINEVVYPGGKLKVLSYSSDPVAATSGLLYYNTVTMKLRVSTGVNTWADIGGGGGSLGPALTSIDGLTTTANQMIYTTASDTYATTSATSAGRDMLAAANVGAQRTLLSSVEAGSLTTANAVIKVDSTTNKVTESGIIVDASDNITGISDLTATNITGTLATASQTNITSVGSLGSLDVTNDITVGGTVDGVDIAAIGVLASNATALSGLTTSEITQLQNIDSTTISAPQWEYLGGSDQEVKTTSDPSFNTVTTQNIFPQTTPSGFNNIYYVSPYGHDLNDGTATEKAFLTIQKGIDTAVTGDAVLVLAGTYTLTASLQIGEDKSITLKSLHGKENTILRRDPLDANTFRIITVTNNLSVVDGFTVRNGVTNDASTDGESSGAGGGILLHTNGGIFGVNVGAVAQNCIIEDCSAKYYGGGIQVFDHKNTVQNCIIRRCTQTLVGIAGGGGINLRWEGFARNCLVYDCLANSIGGGIFIRNGQCQIDNCTVVRNTASPGYYGFSTGGIFVYGSNPYPNYHLITNTLSYGNIGGGVYTNWGQYQGNATFLTSDVSGNDPFLDSFFKPTAASYILINRGTSLSWFTGTTTDLNGGARIMNGRVDIGCYEFQSSSLKAPLASITQPWNLTYYINKASLADVEDGRRETPFKTFSAAMTAFGTPSTAAESKNVYMFICAPGTYDEHIIIPAGRRVTFLTSGLVVIGDGNTSAYFDSATPRNVTIEVDNTVPWDGNFPIVKFGVLSSGNTSFIQNAILNSWIISGDLTHAQGSGYTSQRDHNLILESVNIQGDFDFTTVSNIGSSNVTISNCSFDGVFTGTYISLDIASHSKFTGLITADSIGKMDDCQINAGITCNSINSNILPVGFYNCNWTGAFTSTGGAIVMLVDSATNYWFNLNSGTLAGSSKTVMV